MALPARFARSPSPSKDALARTPSFYRTEPIEPEVCVDIRSPDGALNVRKPGSDEADEMLRLFRVVEPGRPEGVRRSHHSSPVCYGSGVWLHGRQTRLDFLICTCRLPNPSLVSVLTGAGSAGAFVL